MRPLPLDFTLETERLRLRAPHESDIPHVWTASRVPGFTDGMLWHPPERIEDLQAPYDRSIAAWRDGHSYAFTIETKAERQFVGRISLRPREEFIDPADLDHHENVLDVGYWTHPDHQGHGYMSEAIQAVVDLAFETMNAPSIAAIHTLWNVPSQRVLEKAGFRRIRIYEGGFKKNGVEVDEALVRLDRTEWMKRGSKVPLPLEE